MDSTHWEKIDEYLNAAFELEPPDRQAFVEQDVPENLRGQVSSLLARDGQIGGFLASPAIALSNDFFDDEDSPDALLGQAIGNYKILRELGRGGMGGVYLATRTDGEITQNVAIKLLKRELNTADIRRRFRHERQILASLSHPNIAHLLDAGTTDDGMPFLVMEYVEGVPIDYYCERENLDLNARLHLFRTVCAAVQFAHANLIVHRDLKPSNILVTRDGTPKLLDFGISKLLTPEFESDASNTITKLGAMTPEYASPEQLRGESVTTATDVYSLGVILYEVLTGRRPFDAILNKPSELIDAVCNTEPQPPSSVVVADPKSRSEKSTDGNRDSKTTVATPDTNPKFKIQNLKSLRGDLDNIVLKALKKEPERRYSSVEQFAEDIRRYLVNLPVMARRDTLRYRAGKFAHRNKIAVAAGLIIAITLVGGLVTTLWQAQRAEANQARAERRFADVRELSNALLNDIAPKIERLAGSTEARQAVVIQSLKYLDSLAFEAGDDLPLQSELASAYEKVGDLQGNPTNPNLGDMAGAIESYEKAHRIRRHLVQKVPIDFEQRRRLAVNYQSLGNLRWQTNELEESTKSMEAAFAIYEQLVSEQPDSPQLRFAMAEINFDIGKARMDNSKYAEAIGYFRKSLELSEPLRAGEPENPRFLTLVGNCYQKLGNSLSWNEQQKEGETETEKAVQIYESLADAYPDDSSISAGLWQTYWLASSTYEDQNDELSHEYAIRAHKTIENIVGRDPADIQARKRLARSLSRLGQTFTNTGKTVEAVSYLEKAVAETTRLIESDPKSGNTKSNLGAALMRLAEARAKQKEYSRAIAELEKANAVYAELLAADHTDKYSSRGQALITDFKSEIYDEWAKTVSGENRRLHEQNARTNRAQTLEILSKLDAMHTLPESDRKWLEKLKVSVDRDRLYKQ